MAKILVVEDNRDIRLNIIEYLEGRGYITDNTDDGLKALALMLTNRYDLVVLDWMLPGMDGVTLCREIKKRGDSTPILMLSARDLTEDRIEGLTSGVDDYVVKPFSLAELELRIAAILRRAGGGNESRLAVADLEMDLKMMRVSRAGRFIKLNPIAFKMLRVLMQKSPGVVSREEMEEAIWGDNPPDSDSLRTHLHTLRSAVDKPFDRPLIHTEVGFGWALRSGE